MKKQIEWLNIAIDTINEPDKLLCILHDARRELKQQPEIVALLEAELEKAQSKTTASPFWENGYEHGLEKAIEIVKGAK